MNICIKNLQGWLEKHPKTKEWFWFAGLWFGGLLTVVAFTYPIKLLIRSL